MPIPTRKPSRQKKKASIKVKQDVQLRKKGAGTQKSDSLSKTPRPRDNGAVFKIKVRRK